MLFSVNSTDICGQSVELSEQCWATFTYISVYLGHVVRNSLIESKSNSKPVAVFGQKGGWLAELTTHWMFTHNVCVTMTMYSEINTSCDKMFGGHWWWPFRSKGWDEEVI